MREEEEKVRWREKKGELGERRVVEEGGREGLGLPQPAYGTACGGPLCTYSELLRERERERGRGAEGALAAHSTAAPV